MLRPKSVVRANASRVERTREIEALIALLDDEDPEVFEHVSDKLKSFGTDIIPVLEEAWSSEFRPVLHERLENLISEIHLDHILADLADWVAADDPDLITGALLVARHHFNDLDADAARRQLDGIHQTVWLEIGPHLTDLEKVNVLNQFIYQQFGFSGSYSARNEVRHFCLNHVLDSKHGNSMSLSLLYLAIARALDLPVYGVPLHRHFILAFTKGPLDDLGEGDLRREVIFYINPMNKGNVFSANEIKEYLKTMDVDDTPDQYTPCSDVDTVRHLVDALAAYYHHAGDFDKEASMRAMAAVLRPADDGRWTMDHG